MEYQAGAAPEPVENREKGKHVVMLVLFIAGFFLLDYLNVSRETMTMIYIGVLALGLTYIDGYYTEKVDELHSEVWGLKQELEQVLRGMRLTIISKADKEPKKAFWPPSAS